MPKNSQHANAALPGLRSAFYCGVGLAAMGLALPAHAAPGVTVIEVITTADTSHTYDNLPIRATGDGAFGLYYYGDGASPDFTVNYTGDIQSDEESAVWMQTGGDVTFIGAGKLLSTETAIFVDAGGDATVNHTGKVDGLADKGIYANAAGAVDVTYRGALRSTGDGITANSYSINEDVVVVASGSVQSDEGIGIYAKSGGDVTVTLDDGIVIASLGDGIYADNFKSTVNYVDYFGTVNVTGVADITSWEGTGVRANASSNVTVRLHEGSSIVAEESGIDANTYGGTVVVDVTGNVTGYQNNGIKAHADSDVTVDYTGTLLSKEDGIYANAYGSGGDVDVYAAGSVTSWEGTAIYALAVDGGAVVENHASLQAFEDGIFAKSNSNTSAGTAGVRNYGDIHADNGMGILAESTYKSASVYNEGDIFAKTVGIYVKSVGSSNSSSSVESYGNIATNENEGIYAQSINGYVSVTSVGAITSQADAIKAVTYGDDSDDTITVSTTGVLTSRSGSGVYADASHEAVSVTARDSIFAKQSGIFARSQGDDSTATVFVDWSGMVLTSLSGYGIQAHSTDSSVTVKASGTIISYLDGIRATANLDTQGSRVNVTHENGFITALNGFGIYATGTEGGVTVVNVGAITADEGGIYAYATGDREGATAIVDNTGDIKSYKDAGIYAKSSSETVTVSHGGGTIDGVLGAQYGIQALADTKSVTVTIDADGVVKNANTAGILMRAIDGSTLYNYGTITGGPGLALQTKGYNGSLVYNYGTLSGSVEFNGGTSDFFNIAGATYDIFNHTNFTGGWLTNDGILSPGGSGNVTSAFLQAEFEQGSEGVFLVDVDGQTADFLEIEGNAKLDGELQLNFFDMPETTSQTVLTSYWLDQRDLTLANIAVIGTIKYVDDTDVVVDIDGYDFNPIGLNDNGDAVGEAVNTAWDNNNTQLSPLFAALASLTTTEEYENAIQQLTPEVYAENILAAAQVGNLFTGRLFSCKVQDGANRFSAEGECQWVSASASSFEQTATDEYQGFSQRATSIAAGGQWALDQDWRVGLGLGYSSTSSVTDAGATSDGGQVQGGVVVKYDHEGMMIAGALTAGNAAVDTERTVSFGGLDEVLTGSSDTTFLSARMQASYTFDLGDTAYVKPLLDVDLTNLHFGGLEETGGVSALTLSAADSLVATIAPSFELGSELALSDSVVARPYVRVGGSISNTDGMHVVAAFAGETSDFEVKGGGDNVLAKIGTGIDVITANNITMRAYYEGAFGETTAQSTFGFKFGGQF